MSSGGGIGSTLTSGIQDIAGILPLLGTEQCSIQVSSALTRGYLYAAATPMSIFGSLGLVSAGFKTWFACISFGCIEGAKILGNIGFEPQGENLSLIMIEAGKASKGKDSDAGRYVIESRIDELIEELNIDKNRITGISHKSVAWNVKMIATTALLCAFSITPYIYLNLGANSLNKTTIWVFPVLRTTGGFITATLIQLLLQRRITTLSDKYLVKRDQQRNTDVEAAGDTRKHRTVAQYIAPTWLLLCLLLIGLVASVVGYVGCFSVVQNSTSANGPVSWLCLEVGLSVMRVAIWAWNPTWDDAPPLEFILELDKQEHKPLPTCNKDNEEILRCKVLPLTRARDFLKIITSFAGLIQPFSIPDLSLYYTLTRKHPSKKSVLPGDDESEMSDESESEKDKEPEIAEKHKLGERILYITVFNHKERTTRVYTRDDEKDTFYSTTSDAPVVDVGRFLLEVEIDAEIDPKGDPVSSDSNNLDSLRNHYQSILEHIQYRLGAGDATKLYAIENNWTMKEEDTISRVQKLREGNGDGWEAVVKKGKGEEENEESPLISDYFKHASIERERKLLDEKRVKWIGRRMEMIINETKERFQGEMGAVEKKLPLVLATKSPEEIERMLSWERYLMELLLLYEVKEWEELFWKLFKALLDQIDNDRVEEKDRWTKEWRANYWKRVSSQMDAALERLPGPPHLRRRLAEQWASSISQLLERVEKPNSISLSDIREGIKNRQASKEPLFILRMEREIEDTEFRLKRGSDLGLFNQFWDDDYLFRCRYSQSKWAFIGNLSDVPLEVYLHALKGNKNIIHVTLSQSNSDSDVKQFHDTICDLPPWVTSISCNKDSFARLPAIRRDLLFIKSTDNDLVTFAKDTRLKMDLSSTYIFTDAGGFDMVDDAIGVYARVLISFVAPTSGRLILRLQHSGKDGCLEVTLGSTIIQLSPSSSGSSLTIDTSDISLYPIRDPVPSESDHLLFEPGSRNDIVVQFGGELEPELRDLYLHDIELLDEAGLEYPRTIPSSSFLSTLS